MSAISLKCFVAVMAVSNDQVIVFAKAAQGILIERKAQIQGCSIFVMCFCPTLLKTVTAS